MESSAVPRSSWLDPRVVVGGSPIDGQGLFAGRPIRAGELVAVLGGEVIDDAELERIASGSRPYSSITVAEGRHLLLDPEHPIRFGNHGCAPNLWLDGATSLVARRDIAPREELTQDYATYTGVESWRMPCRCGSDSCRGVVTGWDWRLPALHRAYGDRWAAPLLARIGQAGDAYYG